MNGEYILSTLLLGAFMLIITSHEVKAITHLPGEGQLTKWNEGIFSKLKEKIKPNHSYFHHGLRPGFDIAEKIKVKLKEHGTGNLQRPRDSVKYSLPKRNKRNAEEIAPAFSPPDLYRKRTVRRIIHKGHPYG